MAARYWVGGTDTWDGVALLKWALTSGGLGGQAVPTSADTVFFDANSGANTVTLGANANCSTLTMTGFTGTIAFSTFKISIAGNATTVYQGATTYTATGAKLLEFTYSGSTGTRVIGATSVTESNAINISVIAGSDIISLAGSTLNDNFTGFSGSLGNTGRIIYGNLTVSTGMTLTAGTNTTTFGATSGTQAITTNSKTLDFPITFNGVGGTFQLQDAMTVGSTRTVTLTNGTLDLNSKNLTCGLFSSSNSNTRTLAFGTGQMYLTGNNATIWGADTQTNFNYTGTAIVNATYSGSVGSRGFTSGLTGGTESNAINFNVTAGSDTIVFYGTSRKYGFVNLTGFSGIWSSPNWTYTLYGSLTIPSGVTTSTSGSYTGPITFGSTSGTKTITTNGLTVPVGITMDGVGGTFQFQDALTQGSTKAFTITNGTVQFKSGVTSTVGSFVTSGTNQKYLQSSVAGSQATLSQASGTVSVNNLTIQDIYATGGAIWLALNSNGNIDAGNNIGWEFVNFLAATVKFTRRKTKRYFL